MLKPVAPNNIANRASWNQSIPKYHRYSGTAVSVRTNVPIKNELVVQLMRSVGMRKINGGNWCRISASLISAENDVLLCPGMNTAAMGTGELLCFHFGCLPTLFFDCPSRVGQF